MNDDMKKEEVDPHSPPDDFKWYDSFVNAFQNDKTTGAESSGNESYRAPQQPLPTSDRATKGVFTGSKSTWVLTFSAGAFSIVFTIILLSQPSRYIRETPDIRIGNRALPEVRKKTITVIEFNNFQSINHPRIAQSQPYKLPPSSPESVSSATAHPPALMETDGNNPLAKANTAAKATFEVAKQFAATVSKDAGNDALLSNSQAAEVQNRDGLSNTSVKNREQAFDPPSPNPMPTLSAKHEGDMLMRARDLLRSGDVISARLIFQYLANQSSYMGAVRLAQSYDPAMISQLNLPSAKSDANLAKAWYKRAAQLEKIRGVNMSP